MLQATVFDLKYCRTLVGHLSPEAAAALQATYDYVFVVCYEGCSADQFETVGKTAALIDLRRGVEAAFARFHATSRNEVRRAEKTDGLVFHSGFADSFDALYAFYASCERARAWRPVPENEMQNSLFFYAALDGVPFSGMSVYAEAGRLRVSRIFSLKKAASDPRWTNLLFGSAAKRLVLDICRYGAECGYHTLDLGGIDLKDAQKSGISRFKLSLGAIPSPVVLARYAGQSFLNQQTRIQAAGYDIT